MVCMAEDDPPKFNDLTAENEQIGVKNLHHRRWSGGPPCFAILLPGENVFDGLTHERSLQSRISPQMPAPSMPTVRQRCERGSDAVVRRRLHGSGLEGHRETHKPCERAPRLLKLQGAGQAIGPSSWSKGG